MASVIRDVATAMTVRHANVFSVLFMYGQKQYATSKLSPVCALGKDDRQRSIDVSVIVTNSVGRSEQNGRGKLTENLSAAKTKPNSA